LANPSLALTIPLFDEEGNVESVTRGLLDAFRTADVPTTLQLVDNGSRDGTRDVIKRLEHEEPEVRGVYLDANAGYGGGILAGMNSVDADVVGYMWGDDQVAAEDVVRVYRRLLVDDADLAKARRVQRIDGLQRAIVTRVYNTATLWLFHITSTDTNGCPKLFRRETWHLLRPQSSDWFLDPEIMIDVAQKGLKLSEVDVRARPRTQGVSKVGSSTVIEFLVNLARAKLRSS
jgi:glycosyltransferase involved in cell wall biosynthesis